MGTGTWGTVRRVGVLCVLLLAPVSLRAMPSSTGLEEASAARSRAAQQCGPERRVEESVRAGSARWQQLPPTPSLPPEARTARFQHGDASLFYALLGEGTPVLLLHGGLANANYLSDLARALSVHYRVIMMDSRGHGRSTGGTVPLGYDLMADDVVALLDHLGLRAVPVVGWSDGAIIGLDLAMRHPERVGGVFAFGANTDPSGNVNGADRDPVVMGFFQRACREYARLSPTPDAFARFSAGVTAMWAKQPHWARSDLGTIRTPVWIVDGDHDEMIRQEHTVEMGRQIPLASLMLLPATSHFAFLQDPVLFREAVLDFLQQIH